MAMRILRWYADRVAASWRGELSRLRSRNNKWLWIGLCIFFAFFLIPYLGRKAFSESLLLGVSFVWSTFLAFSFGYILRNPLLIILVYVGAVFGAEVTDLFVTAKEVATSGDIVGATILIGLGIYLILRVNRMERGEV